MLKSSEFGKNKSRGESSAVERAPAPSQLQTGHREKQILQSSVLPLAHLDVTLLLGIFSIQSHFSTQMQWFEVAATQLGHLTSALGWCYWTFWG